MDEIEIEPRCRRGQPTLGSWRVSQKVSWLSGHIKGQPQRFGASSICHPDRIIWPLGLSGTFQGQMKFMTSWRSNYSICAPDCSNYVVFQGQMEFMTSLRFISRSNKIYDVIVFCFKDNWNLWRHCVVCQGQMKFMTPLCFISRTNAIYDIIALHFKAKW